jgi:RHS repeat-associated protein
VACGSEPAAWSLCDIGHQGLFLDKEIGLYDNRHRVLHPRFGRFMQRDPAGYVDGMGLYEYAGGAPTNNSDPIGLRRVSHEEIADWQKEGARRKKKHREKRPAYVEQVRQKITSELCKPECRMGTCTEEMCKNHATQIANAFVGEWLQMAYSPQAFGLLNWIWHQKNDSSLRGDPWDDPDANVHAGWHCYHWAIRLYDPVKKALTNGRCFRILRAGYASGGEGNFNLEHSWIAVLGCTAEKDFPKSGSGAQSDNDKCTVRLDGWKDTQPKAYAPTEHGYTYNFQYTRVVKYRARGLKGWPGATGRRIGRIGVVRGRPGSITFKRKKEPSYIYPP